MFQYARKASRQNYVPISFHSEFSIAGILVSLKKIRLYSGFFITPHNSDTYPSSLCNLREG